MAFKVHKSMVEHDILFRTVLCRHYMNNAWCPYGNSCMYAHGREQLRKVSHKDRSRVVPNRVCHSFLFYGHCPYGVQCRYTHTVFPAPHQVLPVKIPDLKDLRAMAKAVVFGDR